MESITAQDISWIAKSAKRFEKWALGTDYEPWVDNRNSPWWERNVADFIVYESTAEPLWSEKWFQDGMRAFGLIALEREGAIELYQSEAGALFVSCVDNPKISLEDFLNGESVPYKYDPECADMEWSPVDAIGHILAEYYPEELT